jgi:hypothetical protein
MGGFIMAAKRETKKEGFGPKNDQGSWGLKK